MGYDLHITRAKNWAENEGAKIRAEEWLQLVEADPELSLAADNGDYFALWTGPSSYPDPWFDWWEGNVMTKNPDPPIVAKMIELAQRLGGRVQGDDGETYLPEGRVVDDGGTVQDWDWRER